MKKILLIGINARYTHSNLAIRYLRNLTGPKYLVSILEFTINQSLLEILNRILAHDANVIGLSVYIWNSRLVRALIPEIKKFSPDAKIILGGPEVAYEPESWLKDFPMIDNIVSGSGESSWKYLAEYNFEISEKVIFRENPALSDLPFPYLVSDFPDLKNKYIYYEASRGCPFKCSYCLSSRSDQKLDRRDLEKIKDELTFLCAQNINIIKFVDRSFNADSEFSRSIWKLLIDLDPSVKFHFEIHPDLLTQEDLELLRTVPANRFQFEIGIQSLNDKTLEAIHRGSSWEIAEKNIRQLIVPGNIHIHVDLITGLPFEDQISMTTAFNKVYDLGSDHFQLGFLKVLPGTEMAVRAHEFKIKHLSDPPYEVISTNWMDFTEIDKFRRMARLLEIFYNSGHFITILPELVKLTRSAFELYNDLSSLAYNDTDIELSKGWQKNGKLLINYITVKFPTSKEFLLDCLRWDWCRFASAHFYPDFLRTDYLQEAKQDGKELLLKLNLDGFPRHLINKAIYFRSSCEEFRVRFLKGDNIVVFLNKKGRSEIIELV